MPARLLVDVIAQGWRSPLPLPTLATANRMGPGWKRRQDHENAASCCRARECCPCRLHWLHQLSGRDFEPNPSWRDGPANVAYTRGHTGLPFACAEPITCPTCPTCPELGTCPTCPTCPEPVVCPTCPEPITCPAPVTCPAPKSCPAPITCPAPTHCPNCDQYAADLTACENEFKCFGACSGGLYGCLASAPDRNALVICVEGSLACMEMCLGTPED